jgi:hypothetical protein
MTWILVPRHNARSYPDSITIRTFTDKRDGRNRPMHFILNFGRRLLESLDWGKGTKLQVRWGTGEHLGQLRFDMAAGTVPAGCGYTLRPSNSESQSGMLLIGITVFPGPQADADGRRHRFVLKSQDIIPATFEIQSKGIVVHLPKGWWEPIEQPVDGVQAGDRSGMTPLWPTPKEPHSPTLKTETPTPYDGQTFTVEDEPKPKPKDAADVAVATERLAEIEAHPERLVSGAELERRLAHDEEAPKSEIAHALQRVIGGNGTSPPRYFERMSGIDMPLTVPDIQKAMRFATYGDAAAFIKKHKPLRGWKIVEFLAKDMPSIRPANEEGAPQPETPPEIPVRDRVKAIAERAA